MVLVGRDLGVRGELSVDLFPVSRTGPGISGGADNAMTTA